jgi:hypothetical protein
MFASASGGKRPREMDISATVQSLWERRENLYRATLTFDLL